jgi:hypothetical protein
MYHGLFGIRIDPIAAKQVLLMTLQTPPVLNLLAQWTWIAQQSPVEAFQYYLAAANLGEVTSMKTTALMLVLNISF